MPGLVPLTLEHASQRVSAHEDLRPRAKELLTAAGYPNCFEVVLSPYVPLLQGVQRIAYRANLRASCQMRCGGPTYR